MGAEDLVWVSTGANTRRRRFAVTSPASYLRRRNDRTDLVGVGAFHPVGANRCSDVIVGLSRLYGSVGIAGARIGGSQLGVGASGGAAPVYVIAGHAGAAGTPGQTDAVLGCDRMLRPLSRFRPSSHLESAPVTHQLYIRGGYRP